MHTQLDLYKLWAPDDALWTQWVKPVVFMNMRANQFFGGPGLQKVVVDWTGYEKGTMIIVDLPGKTALDEGFALAAMGYRPIPLYNGVPGPQWATAVISMGPIMQGLTEGARLLPSMSINNQANPVFLLDSERFKWARKRPGTFDNRWRLVPQDMPSANYLKRQGITKIIVRAKLVQSDLGFILHQYQKAGIVVYTCGEYGGPRKASSFKPHGLGLFYRFMLIFGLTRCATGGFGMMIPEPSSGSSGSGSYRAG